MQEAKRLHYLQHAVGEDIGNMRPWLVDRGWPISSTRVDLGESLPELEQFDWLVVMGGPMSAYDDHRLPWLLSEKSFIARAMSAGKTVIGICLGAQLLADVLGARVFPAPEQEVGWFSVHKAKSLVDGRLVNWFPDEGRYLCWHGDTFDLPSGVQLLGASDATRHQGFVLGDRVVALQFHLEAVAQTPRIFRQAGGGELPAPGNFVQAWDQLQGSPELYVHSQSVMHQLLSHLALSTGG